MRADEPVYVVRVFPRVSAKSAVRPHLNPVCEWPVMVTTSCFHFRLIRVFRDSTLLPPRALVTLRPCFAAFGKISLRAARQAQLW